MATKLSIVIPDSESWLVEALEAYRNALVKERPRPTRSDVVREALRTHLDAYRPLETGALRESGPLSKHETGFGESEPWSY
jgi:metal-responsive CopG/Arc/MetJ family transcriptional regulator